MKQIIISIIFTFICASCTYDTVVVPDGDIGFINGNVVDALSGATSPAKPLTDCKISLMPLNQHALSYANGDFFFKNIIPGTYIIKAEKSGYYARYDTISVNHKKASTINLRVYPFSDNNTAPSIPTNKYPKDDYTDFFNHLTLVWEASDKEEELMFYSIFFGTNPFPTEMIAHEIPKSQFELKDLQYNQTYYWRILVRDWSGATSLSPIWKFHIKTLASE